MLTILEYADIGSTTRGSIAIPLEPPSVQQAIEVGPNSAQSKPFDPSTCIIKLLSDEDCMIDIGANPDATNSSRKLKAGIEQIISVPMIGGGSGFRIAVAASNMGSVSGMDSLESLLKLIASPENAKSQFAAMQANADKLSTAAKEFRDAAAANKKQSDELIQAAKDAEAAKKDAETAKADLSVRQAALENTAKYQADSFKEHQAALDKQGQALVETETNLAERFSSLNAKGIELADVASKLEARGHELDARETSVAAAELDYQERLAKLKALTS